MLSNLKCTTSNIRTECRNETQHLEILESIATVLRESRIKHQKFLLPWTKIWMNCRIIDSRSTGFGSQGVIRPAVETSIGVLRTHHAISSALFKFRNLIAGSSLSDHHTFMTKHQAWFRSATVYVVDREPRLFLLSPPHSSKSAFLSCCLARLVRGKRCQESVRICKTSEDTIMTISVFIPTHSFQFIKYLRRIILNLITCQELLLSNNTLRY